MITIVDKVLKDIRILLNFELFKVSKMTLSKVTINLDLTKVSKNNYQS